jgi:hypothetical protein
LIGVAAAGAKHLEIVLDLVEVYGAVVCEKGVQKGVGGRKACGAETGIGLAVGEEEQVAVEIPLAAGETMAIGREEGKLLFKAGNPLRTLLGIGGRLEGKGGQKSFDRLVVGEAAAVGFGSLLNGIVNLGLAAEQVEDVRQGMAIEVVGGSDLSTPASTCTQSEMSLFCCQCRADPPL